MENNDTNTAYHKFVRVGDQNWEIVEITIRIIFFAWDLYSLFFIQGIFKSHLKKITPTWSANSHPKSQFDLSPSCINVLKNGSVPFPHHPGRGEGVGGCELCHHHKRNKMSQVQKYAGVSSWNVRICVHI